jgi:hypothetical protein
MSEGPLISDASRQCTDVVLASIYRRAIQRYEESKKATHPDDAEGESKHVSRKTSIHNN